MAAAAVLLLAVAAGTKVGVFTDPGCQCDPSRSGFCNYGDELSTTFDCRGAATACSSAILNQLLNDTTPKWVGLSPLAYRPCTRCFRGHLLPLSSSITAPETSWCGGLVHRVDVSVG